MAGRRDDQRTNTVGASESPEPAIDRVLGLFDRWLGERSPDPRLHAGVLEVVRAACEFKSMFVEPDPTDWAPHVTTRIVGEVLPAKIIGADAAYVAAIVPAMQLYIDFLLQTGRWKPANDEASTLAALARLGDLAPRFGDPVRQSMAARVLHLAADEGVDFGHPTALDEFMQRFNAMPLEWRRRATDACVDAAAINDDKPGVPGPPDGGLGNETAVTTRIPLNGVRPGHVASVTVPPAEEEWAALAATTLCARVLDLAEWVGPGRAVTGTGAMRRDDLRRWCDRWDLPAGSGRTRTMWDVAAIALPWRIGIDCAVIGLDGSRAHPGTRPTGGPTADRVRLGRSLVERLLDLVLVPRSIDRQLLDAINHIMLPMLVTMCVPPGQDLDGLDGLDGLDAMLTPVPIGMGLHDPRMVARAVRTNIQMLGAWGVIVESANHAVIPVPLRPAVVQTINSPLALFRVSLTPGAVPLTE
ncbi:hypothetical protein [Nakamurella sp.]|uniref:hypothetical protein n=1 Tax=Nakamurella sp. TaxID=1869182 RepID=UPI003783BC8A